MHVRKIFVIIFWAGIFYHLWIWTRLPARVADHFNAGGYPNGWIGKDVHLFLMLGLHVFFFLLFYFMPKLTAKIPMQWVSIPNRSFWFQPEHQDKLCRKLGKAMAEIGILLILFFGYIAYLTCQANQNVPVRLENSYFNTVLILFFIGIGLWLVRFYLAFRKP